MKRTHLFAILIMVVCALVLVLVNGSESSDIELRMSTYNLGYVNGVINGMKNVGDKEGYQAQWEIDSIAYRRNFLDMY